MSARILLMSVLLVAFLSNMGYAWTYPYDGKFKQLSPDRDPWFFVDHQHWYIKNPDKWQHFMGCYVAHRLLSNPLDKYMSGVIVMTVGVAKEMMDAYREGYSLRDGFADLLGVGASLLNSDSYKLLCTYNNESVLLRLYLKVPL